MFFFSLKPSEHIVNNTNDGQGHGLLFRYFRVFIAPAAGPRNYPTMGADPYIHATAEDRQERWLVGGSLGALRWCAMLSGTTHKLQAAFTHMVYRKGNTGQDLAKMMSDIFQTVAPDADSIVHHPHFRLLIPVTQLRSWTLKCPAWLMYVVCYMLLVLSFILPFLPDLLLQRRLFFYTGPHPPPFLSRRDRRRVTCLPLTTFNLHQVLHATTSLPLISAPCTYITGHGRGNFVDAALGDYELNFSIDTPQWPGLLLSMSVEGEHIKPRVWDAYARWRRPPASMFHHCSVLRPTRHYQHQLPRQKLPHVGDFFDAEYIRCPELRFKAWHHAYSLSCQHMPSNPAHLLQQQQQHNKQSGSGKSSRADVLAAGGSDTGSDGVCEAAGVNVIINPSLPTGIKDRSDLKTSHSLQAPLQQGIAAVTAQQHTQQAGAQMMQGFTDCSRHLRSGSSFSSITSQSSAGASAWQS